MNSVISIQKKERPRSRLIAINLVVGAVVLGVVVVLGLRIGLHSGGGLQSQARVGQPAPQFEIENLVGDSLVSLDQMGDKPVWLTFWASWCPPCRVEMPDLDQVISGSHGDTYEYLAISFGEDPELVRDYMERTGYTLPVGVDPTAEIAIRYAIYGLPTHVFINSDGEIVDIYSGVLKREQIELLTTDLW